MRKWVDFVIACHLDTKNFVKPKKCKLFNHGCKMNNELTSQPNGYEWDQAEVSNEATWTDKKKCLFTQCQNNKHDKEILGNPKEMIS